jgi:hypothetical protein
MEKEKLIKEPGDIHVISPVNPSVRGRVFVESVITNKE